ncbi:MAG TPA: methylated-DNA--[protein]-cysteine S-methyltransferase [Methylophilaceae bacterium]|nr:methylated-DNA--[protein]-cysteine S-methyltransferase [Methylophilaceae bacterium]
MENDYDAIMPTPFGALGIQVRDDFLTRLDFLTEPHAEQRSTDGFVQSLVSQLSEYFRDPGAILSAPYAVKGTPFQKRVWRAIAAIPPGQTLTYGELADKVGSGPRAVANVCGANQVPLFIPCHRVVAKNGLGGFMQGKENGLSVKQWLLQHEKSA